MLLRGEPVWLGGSTLLRFFVLGEGFASVNFIRIKNQTIPWNCRLSKCHTHRIIWLPFNFINLESILPGIKTCISFMWRNSKVHMLAKYILYEMSKSSHTKKQVLVKSLFYFLIFCKLYQLRIRPNCSLPHT